MPHKPFHTRTRPGESPWWWYDFRLNGQRHRGPTDVPAEHPQAEADRAAAAIWLEACHREGAQPESPATSGETDTLTLIQLYADTELSHKAMRRGPRYRGEIVSALNIHVAARFPAIGEITTDAWNAAQGEMHAAGWSLRTCQRVTSHLRGFLDFCERRRALLTVPKLRTASNEEVAAKAKTRRAFTKAERARFLRAMRQLDLRAWRVYTVLFYTCLRKGGLEALRDRWIDWRRGYVTIPAGAIKNRHALTLYLRGEARRAIRSEQADRKIDRDLPIFGAFDYGRDSNHEADGGLFWRAVRAARIDEHRLVPHHVTRHTAATIAGDDGASLAELMALGGWRTPAMAMRYMHEDRERAKRAVKRL